MSKHKQRIAVLLNEVLTEAVQISGERAQEMDPGDIAQMASQTDVVIEDGELVEAQSLETYKVKELSDEEIHNIARILQAHNVNFSYNPKRGTLSIYNLQKDISEKGLWQLDKHGLFDKAELIHTTDESKSVADDEMNEYTYGYNYSYGYGGTDKLFEDDDVVDKIVQKFVDSTGDKIFNHLLKSDLIRKAPEGVYVPTQGDGPIYTTIGQFISDDKSFAFFYDNLREEQKDQIHEILIEKLAEKYNLEW